MKKIVVVSTNNNPDYYFYSPYIRKAWNKLGWEVCCMITSDVDPMVIDADYICVFPDVEGVRKETIAQASRLYAAHFFTGSPDTLLMTSDMDLLPLSDYWKPEADRITSYGHDLTWKTFIPMGYCAMPVSKWQEVMNLTHDMKADMWRDANEPNIPHSPLSDKWEDWWNFDWCLLTRRLRPHWDKITFIDRGQVDLGGATLAKGRVDRFNWDATLKGNTVFIDAHVENVNVKHPIKLEPFINLFERFYGKL